MAKIGQSNNKINSSIGASISPSANSPKVSSEVEDSSASGQASYDEKGFYYRESRLLINEAGTLLSTENSDNFLLEIRDTDTINVESEISGKHI